MVVGVRSVSSGVVVVVVGFLFGVGFHLFMGGRSTTTTIITTTVKGEEEEEAWFQEQQQERKSSCVNAAACEPISIRVSKPTQQQQPQQVMSMFGRQSSAISVGGGVGEAEEEEDDGGAGQSICCFPLWRGRYNQRKPDSFDGVQPGSTFSRLDTESLRSLGWRSLDAAALCCCGCCGWPRRRSGKWVVEVRGMQEVVKKAHGSDDRLRTAGRWEVDVNDEYFKPPPMWKQLVRKVKAQVVRHHHVHGASSRSDWLNYDPQSYEKNFDNGEFRQQQFYAPRSLQDENDDDHGAREAALHTALLQRLASSRSQSQQGTTTTTTSSLPSPAPPVKLCKSKEEFEKAKEDFVPIWQRRAATTPMKLDLLRQQQQSGDEE